MVKPQALSPDISQFERLAERFSLIPLDGKRPIEANWQRFCTIRRAFKKEDFEGKNAGICCGPASGLLVLDVDDPEAFTAIVESQGLSLPETMQVQTGSGKPHYYFRYPDDGRTYGNKGFKHPVFPRQTIFDVRGAGGQVVAPGSIHPDTGQHYRLYCDGPIANPPDWLLGLYDGRDLDTSVLWDTPLPNPKDREYIDSLTVSEGIKTLILGGKTKGERSEATASVICSLLRGGYSEDIIRFIFQHYPIGEKYREKGSGKEAWLSAEIRRNLAFIGEETARAPSQTSNPLDPSPEDLVQEINKKHAVVMVGGKFSILNEDWDPIFNRPNVTFSNKHDFVERYGNVQVPNPGNGPAFVKLGALWLRSPDRRQYDGITFSPGLDPPGYYNLYRGFGVEPRPGDWSLFDRHIAENIANGDEEVAQYILDWIAHLFQSPGGRRPGTAIVLRGKRGTGKGVFANNIGQIMGSHYLHVANQRMLTGQFNNHLKDALLVFCDEAFWAGDKSAEGVLKAMITEDQIMVEPKGKDPFVVKNYIRLIMASNEDWVVPAGLEERRFLVLDVSDRHMQDYPYFSAIGQQMDNGGREAMLHDLLERDIENVNLSIYPRTKALLDQIISSMSPVGKYIYEQLQTGTLGKFDNDWGAIRTDSMYEGYQDFCKTIGVRFRTTPQEFGKQLKGFFPDLGKKRLKISEGYDAGDRKLHYVFPPLEKCRAQFEQHMNMEIEWDE